MGVRSAAVDTFASNVAPMLECSSLMEYTQKVSEGKVSRGGRGLYYGQIEANESGRERWDRG
jgi:hypothetical protein